MAAAARCRFTRQSHEACFVIEAGSSVSHRRWINRLGKTWTRSAGELTRAGLCTRRSLTSTLSADLLTKVGEHPAYQRSADIGAAFNRLGMGKAARSAFKHVPTLSRLLPL